MMYRTFLAALCAAASVTPAFAQDAGSHVTAAISAGSLGIGPEISFRFSDHLGVRGSASFLNFSHDFDSDDLTYSGKLKLQNYGLMVDLYPMGGGFRVSAGARINRNRARATATPSGATEIGTRTYTAAQIGTINGRADVRDVAPALTLGWAGANRSGFFFGADAGALFQGKARLRQFTATGTAASSAAFQSDLEIERRDLQDDISKFKVYPILQFSLGYRF